MRRSIFTGKTVMTLATAFMVLLLAAVPGGAATVLITSESGITADGVIDWGLLGGAGTYVGSPTAPVGVTGISGLSVTASNVGTGGLLRLDQGTGWFGNFGVDEKLLYSGTSWIPDSTGPITLNFSSPVGGVGAQIESNYFGTFTGSIEAFDASNVSLGFYSFPGVSNGLADDSAIFIGILSDSANIAKLVFGVPDAPFGSAQDFAINGPIVQAGAPIPEPGMMMLVGSGLVGLAGWGRRRFKK